MQSHPVRILLIDDDEDNYIVVRDLLSNPSSMEFIIERVSDYGAALDAILSGEFDVCLLDRRLKERNGLELMQEALSRGAMTPIVFLIGKGDYGLDLEVMSRGAADCLTKGELSAPLLERSIRLAMERRRMGAPRPRKAQMQAEDAARVSLRFLEIVNEHTEIAPLLREYVSEIKNSTGCDAVGIRVLDENWNIPYVSYQGFSREFYESESPLSMKTDECMCINVVRGDVDPRLPFYTEGGAFCVNATSRFLAGVSEEEKGRTRNRCNSEGYETVALFPFRSGGKILGLIHVADHRENMVPPNVVKMLEKAAMQLGTAFQRARTESKLRESEEHYRSLFDHMLNGYAYCRMHFDQNRPKDFTYLNVNNAFETLTGLKDVVGKKVSEVIPGIQESDPELLEVYGRVALSGNPEQFETYVESLGMWFSVSVYSPRKEYFAAVFDVITERKRAEEALRASEQKYRRLYESIMDAFVAVDMSGRIVEFNPAFLEMLGYSRDELMGLTYMDVTPARWHDTEARIVKEEVLPFGHSEVYEKEYRKKDGTVFPVEIRTFLIKAGRGVNQGMWAIVRDISQRKQLEEKGRKGEAQLRQAQKMEALGTLAGGIAHDFNNILGIIVGYTQMAQWNTSEGSKVSGDLQQVLRAAGRAKDLVQQILAFSRQHEQENNPVQVGLIVREALKMLRSSLPSTIAIKSNVASKKAILADPTQIHQVLMNLCANAAHAMGDGGTLEVNLTDIHLGAEDVPPHSGLRDGPHVRLTVKDTGLGIDPAIIERIFDPIFTTKEVGVGTGLGLAVVHGIVKSHGGSIDVDSLPGKGTTFKVLFPAIAHAQRVEETRDLLPRGHGRILVVDDEPALAAVLQAMLERLGYEVDCRTGSVEALEAFRNRPVDKTFDIVITDMTMPHLTGADLAKQLHRLQPDLPIILCTGFSDKIDAEKAKGLGILGFLLKPVSIKDLAELLQKALPGKG